jgi:hypothetical protein
MTGERRDCGRTASLIDRIVDGRVTDDDRRHAATCDSCGPVLARAARFDDEIARTARRLVPEDLPPGVLDPSLGGVEGAPRMSGLAPGFASSVAAVAVAVLAIALVLRPPGPAGPGGTAEPLTLQPSPGTSIGIPSKPPGRQLKTTGELVVRLTGSLKYACSMGQDVPDDPVPPAERVSAVCVSPVETTSYGATYTVGTTAGGQVVTVAIRADPVEDTPDARDAVAEALASLVKSAFAKDDDAIEAADFVHAKVPELEAPTPAAQVTVDGVRVDLQRRANGVYLVDLVLVTPAQ